MAAYDPPIYNSNIFNESLFIDITSGLSIQQADNRYLRLTGGIVSGYTVYQNGLSVLGTLSYNGTAVDLSAITGVVAGTASASKALIVDTNKDITGIRYLTASQLTGTLQTAAQTNITSLGTLSSLTVSGALNATLSTAAQPNITSLGTLTGLTTNGLVLNGGLSSAANWINCSSTIQITGGVQATSGNGIGIYFVPMASTGYVVSHNHALSTKNNINIADDTIYCKANSSTYSNIGLFTASPGALVDINQSSSTSNRLRLSYAVGSTFGEMYCDSSAYLNLTNTPVFNDNTTRLSSTGYVQNELTSRSNATLAPTGFVDRTTSSISYNPSTRVFTISPIGTFYVWVNGVRYSKSSPISIAAHAITAGQSYWIFFDNTGNLQIQNSAPSLLNIAMVAVVYYYSASVYMLLEERHGASMSVSSHIELHNVIGTFYRSGLALSGYTLDGTTDASNTYALSAGVISDEDLESSISAVSDGNAYTVFYLTGSSSLWTYTAGNAVPYAFGTYIQYNQWSGSAWQLTDLSTNNWVNYYILITPSTSTSTQVLNIPGQAVYTSLAAAQAESFSSLTISSLLLPEYLVLYQITYKASASLTTSGKCQIAAVQRYSNSRSVSSASTVSNHQALSGLQLAASGSTYGHISDTTQSIAGVKTFSDTTDSSSSITGGMICSGGVGISKKLYVGSDLEVPNQFVRFFTSTNYTDSNGGPKFTCYGPFMARGINSQWNDGSANYDTAFACISGNATLPVKLVVQIHNGDNSTSTNPAFIGTETVNDLRIGTGNSTRMIITSGGLISFNNTTDSTSSTDGAFKIAGGMGIAKKLYVGTGIYGTLQTVAQANITSVGTLTGLNTSGAINITSTSADAVKITNSSTTGLANLKFVGDTATWELGTRGSAASDPKNGLYIYNGSIRMSIDSSGRVGIGKTTMISALDVDGSINASSGYTLTGNSMDASALVGVTRGTVSASKAMIVDANRALTNMGAFSIEDAGATPLSIYNSALTSTNSIGLNLGRSSASNQSFQIQFNYNTTSTDTSTLSFAPYGAANSLVIKGNEYIGFNVAEPLWPLHGPNSANDKSFCLYGTSTGATDWYGLGTNNNAIKYQAKDIHAFYINSKGNALGDYVGEFNTAGLYVEKYSSGSASGSERYSALSDTTFSLNELGPSGTYTYSIRSNQGILVENGSFWTRSDKRTKEDIICYSDLSKERIVNGIMDLDLHSFYYKKDPVKRPHSGLIAQECFQKRLYELISYFDDPDLEIEEEGDIKGIGMSIDYSKIGLLLIPVVQSLQAQLDKQERTIHELQQKLNMFHTI